MTAKVSAVKAQAIELFSTRKQIDAAIADLHTQGQSLQQFMHKIACSVLKHVGAHRDVRVVAKFLQSMPESSRVNALRSWLEAFGPIAFNGNDAVYVGDKKTDLKGAMRSPFWSFKPEAAYMPLDVAAAIEALIKRLETDTKKTAIDGHKGNDHTQTIVGLRSLVKPAQSDPLAVH